MAKSKKWARIKFKFKTQRQAFRLYRYLSLGKELGLLPESVEFMMNGTELQVGHYGEEA